jgi:hypothetical protein
MMMVMLKSMVVDVHVFVEFFLQDVPFAFYANLLLLVLVDDVEVIVHIDHLDLAQIVHENQVAWVHSYNHVVVVDHAYQASFHQIFSYLVVTYEVVVVLYPSYGVVDQHRVNCSSSSFVVDVDQVDHRSLMVAY